MELKEVEEKRRTNVVKAMEDLLEKDCKYKEELNSQTENKMMRADSLRKQRLEDLSRASSEHLRY
jgi:hypothetical protein